MLYGQLAGKQAVKSAHLFALTPGAPLTVFLCVCAWECVCGGGCLWETVEGTKRERDR